MRLGLDKALAEQTRTTAITDSMQREVDRIDAELAKRDLPAAKRQELQAERETLQKSAEYLGVARSRSEQERAADRAAGPPTLDDPAEQVKMSTDFIARNKIDTGVPFIDHGLEKAIANPALIFYKLQANAYKFAWALIPLSLAFGATGSPSPRPRASMRVRATPCATRKLAAASARRSERPWL